MDLIDTLRIEHGPILFFHSGGGCESSALMCYPIGDVNLSDMDVYLGSVNGASLFIGMEQFAAWQHSQLVIDVADGDGAPFSLDVGTGKRFLIRPRDLTDAESSALPARHGAPPLTSHE